MSSLFTSTTFSSSFALSIPKMSLFSCKNLVAELSLGTFLSESSPDKKTCPSFSFSSTVSSLNFSSFSIACTFFASLSTFNSAAKAGAETVQVNDKPKISEISFFPIIIPSFL